MISPKKFRDAATLQAIDRAASLLTAVIRGAEPDSFTELAAASGLHVTAADGA